ncbi:hypothetical protein [Hymenobacter sp. AT01-02]|uniref:hypothetical protein n=1 Tax=Hymenobacter sp. AT01-02 TaxID=1571877 RepID=UPI000AABE379|nr:hypothetical protein [Hymenobacter sp. AT01-02]
MQQTKFLWITGLISLTVISVYLTLLLHSHSYQAFLRFADIEYNNTFYHATPYVTGTTYSIFRAFLSILCICALFVLLHACAKRNTIYTELAHLRKESRAARLELFIAWNRTSYNQRLIVLLLGSSVLIARVFYFFNYPVSDDEITSYNFFVSKGITYVSSYYPLPNNHILYNSICWIFHQLHVNFYWTSRLPTLLISGAGTYLVYLLLLRFSNFTIATCAVFIFCFSPYGLEYAFVGRGYFLLFYLASISFFAGIQLIYEPNKHKRLSWFSIISSSILGFYTVPTFLYPFLSLVVVLTISFVKHKRKNDILNLAVACAIIALCGTLLYTPVLAVSGLQSLIGNKYVAAKNAHEFWATFLPFYSYSEGFITGQERLGIWFTACIIIVCVYVLQTEKSSKIRLLGIISCAYVLLPFLFVVAQRVLTPARVLSYRVLFLALLFGICYDRLSNVLFHSRRVWLVLIPIGIFLYGIYGIFHTEQRIYPLRVADQRIHTVYQLLHAKNSRRILVNSRDYVLLLYHYLHQQDPSIIINTEPQPSTAYEYAVIDYDKHPPNFVGLSAKEVYHDGYVRVFSYHVQQSAAHLPYQQILEKTKSAYR